VVSDRIASLSKEEARLEARHCSAERARDAWDSTGSELAKLPRLPLVYRGVGDTNGVPLPIAKAMLGKAPMPLACSQTPAM
jgi:hypothetical protein